MGHVDKLRDREELKMSTACANEIKTFMIVGQWHDGEREIDEQKVFRVLSSSETYAKRFFEDFKNDPPYCQFEDFFLVEVIAERKIVEYITPQEIEESRERFVRIPCAADDFVRCFKCGKISKVTDLHPQNDKCYPKSVETGCWQTVYFYCPCDSEHPMAWTSGDGDYVIFGGPRAELVGT